MNLKLKRLRVERPLAAIDLETTGTDPSRDRIVELAVIRVEPDRPPRRFVRRLHPGVSIPPTATAVHGITDADVAGLPTFGRVAQELARLLEHCDLIGFGIARLDLPLLVAEFARCGMSFRVAGRAVVDALELYRRMEARDLTSAVAMYLGRDHREAH